MGIGFVALVASLMVGGPALGALSVYISSNGDAADNTALQNLLTSAGYSWTMGVAPASLSGTTNFGSADVILLNMGGSATPQLIPTAGQNNLVAFVNAGGGLVTGEWAAFNPNNNTILKGIMPVVGTWTYSTVNPIKYTSVTADPIMNAGGLGTKDITFTATNHSGTAVQLVKKTTGNPIVFYSANTPASSSGVVGWEDVGGPTGGRVLSFNCILGWETLAASNADFRTLLVNGINWASTPAPVPEPASAALMVVGGVLALLRTRRARAR
jgi:hypothetical protein